MAIKLVHPSIVIDGHDITDYVRSYEVRQSVYEPATMTLELYVPDAKGFVEQPAIADHARVVIGEQTRAALIALGWRPPDPR